LQRCFLKGYDQPIKSDGEYYGTENGISTQYEGYQVRSSIQFADRYLKGETRIEVGLKYAEFKRAKFHQLFNIVENKEVVGYVSPFGEREVTMYEYLRDDKGNVFTCSVSNMFGAGNGGYSGLVFTNEADAFKFVKFLLGSKTHYVKDVEIGWNGLGAWGLDELDKHLTKFDAVAWAETKAQTRQRVAERP
jgi:hypothetical protein